MASSTITRSARSKIPQPTVVYSPIATLANRPLAAATRDILSDDSHPSYIQMSRRADAFDPKKLHWAVITNKSISQKRFLRAWAAHRMKSAFVMALRERGLDEQGKPLPLGGRSSPQPLFGSLVIRLASDPLALTITKTDTLDVARSILKRISHKASKKARG